MTMAPEIQDYYRYLLGEVGVQPGPIVLPDGFTATALAKIIHHTLVKKASLLEDVRHVQILYSAWAILNDAYTPINADFKAVQTDFPLPRPSVATGESTTQTAERPAVQDCAVQAFTGPQVRAVASQTSPPYRLETRDGGSQTAGRPALRSWAVQTVAVSPARPAVTDAAAQTAAVPQTPAGSQTEPVKRRTKWTQMRRRPACATGTQTESPPPPPPAECRPAETQTVAAGCRAVETQTLLPAALGGRRTAATQTARCRPPWAVRLVRGARPPPAERPQEPRRFHGRRLLRRGHDDAPAEIPLVVTGSPSAAPADPRLAMGSESGGGGRRDCADSDSASIASPTGPACRRSRSVSSGGEPDPVPDPAPAGPPRDTGSPPDPPPDPAPALPALGDVDSPPDPPPAPAPAPPAPDNASSPTYRISPVRFVEETATEEAAGREAPLSLDAGLMADLDTSRSYLSAPPARPAADGGAATRSDASAAQRLGTGDRSDSDMDLDAD